MDVLDKVEAYFATVTPEQLVKDLEAAGFIIGKKGEKGIDIEAEFRKGMLYRSFQMLDSTRRV
jgi:hypothetical protein